MGTRKTIGVIIAEPESVYQQRILKGIFRQCEKYGYNAAVFCSLSKLGISYKQYQDGEANIFELINFELLDGIIVPPITLSGDEKVSERVLERLQNECSKPVVSLDIPYGDYPVVNTDDRSAFSSITAHIIDVHQCRNIYFLTGTTGFTVSEQRLAGFTDMMKKRDIPVDDSMIFYGDFWYSGGESLADKIISGEVKRPEAVICASDHMAIGLANRLAANGIRVPEDIIVTGYDATSEAVLNDITITTCVPDVAAAAGKAVDHIRSQIEPEAEIDPLAPQKHSGLRICSSCGCPENMAYVKDRLNDSLLRSNRNYGDKDTENHVDINMLLESYVFESFAGSVDAHDCLDKIYRSIYLIKPFERFWLCLKEEWLNADEDASRGYPDKMRMAVYRYYLNDSDNDPEGCYICENGGEIFDTGLMLPQMWEENNEPKVFYFAPVHYNEYSLGYAAVQCSLTEEHIIGNVFRNWLRNVNNALEMIRVRTQLQMFSERDAMTGLYNRRGMDKELQKLFKKARPSDKLLVFVIDMDGLKNINDNYGHSEGDYGIRAIANVSRQIARNDDICIRAGGDEFYIIGVGDYNSIDALVRVQRFNQALEEANKAAGKPYEISASIGYCCESLSHRLAIEELLRIADGRMYENKVQRKKQRKE